MSHYLHIILMSVNPSNVAFSVYRLMSLPAIVNDEQFVYSNMPEAVVINEADQTVILWKNVSKKDECLFSNFVYCQKNHHLFNYLVYLI